ncbi:MULTISPECIES: GreA/GreB family elongation factor [Pseudomonas]|uniref:Transcription elongation factor GreAB n=1 Tax=Pseudomonas quercus TaxID=2722792 RepID=A0ABX0Y9T2_9PSED|nr:MULTISPECIES: GreA/GreB family elongation factor [Pseudomonas]MBF7141566.1 GreA/GreB family elongation factor [Pseudomonas sp. LY10J]NJP00105.1 transcription elongation factor GreAB [Pseudomonas quercus]
MDKQALQRLIVEALERDLDVARRAAQTAYETATHEENIAENKYDTLGLEASYLATGQARRMSEIAQALTALRALPATRHCPDRGLQLGDYVVLENPDGHVRALFIGPDAAGLVVHTDNSPVTVITPRAPLGQALLGRQEGDEVQVQVAGKLQTYVVVEAS